MTAVHRLAATLALLAGTVHADPAPPGAGDGNAAERWAFKLTPSWYATSHATDAADLNLRAKHGPHALWVGYYRRGNEFGQARSGYEYTWQRPDLQIVPSLQLATHGFAGGSLNTRIGDAVYGLLGFGRTNGRDYYNLNFDPNDSVLYGFGTHLLPDADLALFTVKDNRLHTGQTITHLLWRLNPDVHRGWSVDLFAKHGRAGADDDPVSARGLAATYDYCDVFVRLVRDRKVNFTADDQTRVALGLRF